MIPIDNADTPICLSCGDEATKRIRAWYPDWCSQGIILGPIDPNGRYDLDYDGSVKHGDAGENDDYWCECGANAKQLEQLVAPLRATICECGHWYDEHTDGGHCAPTCTCPDFRFSSANSTPAAIADRGGDPDLWPLHVKLTLNHEPELYTHAWVNERASRGLEALVAGDVDVVREVLETLHDYPPSPA